MADATIVTLGAGAVFTTFQVAGQSDVDADGNLDTLTLAAGSNITLTTNGSTDTITIAAASATDSFKTIQVSGQSDVVADDTEDLLILAAGSNITITTNAGTDTITITAADTNTQLTEDQVDDFVNGLIVASTNITKVYDDTAGTLTLSSADTHGNAFTTVAVSGQDDVVADSITDTLTFAAGSNVTLTTTAGSDTVTVAAADTHGNAFTTVAVSGQDNVVADSVTDTLTFAAGSNVTLTTTAGSDTVTIASTNTTGGWTDGSNIITLTTTDDKVGIGQGTPLVALDVSQNPTALSGDTGGGESVKFGSGSLTAGKLYYLHTDGAWTLTDANAVGSGASQLLGIALGTSPTTHGMLIRGFFDVASYLTGTFVQGAAVYISETTTGNIDVAAPAGGSDFVRIVGYGTTTANVIYFNPSNNWVQL